MTSIATYDLFKSLLKNTYFTTFIVFAAWIAAIMSGSVLVILAGLVAYLRPLLLASLLRQNRRAEVAKKTEKVDTSVFPAFSFNAFALGLAR